MSTKHPNPTYTIDIQPVGDHLQVTILELPELGMLETAPGKIKRDDATEVALAAISKWQHEHEHEQVQVKAS
jgi:hypothetical protein